MSTVETLLSSLYDLSNNIQSLVRRRKTVNKMLQFVFLDTYQLVNYGQWVQNEDVTGILYGTE